MIRRLPRNASVAEIDEELSYTCRRLGKDPKAASLADEPTQLQDRWLALRQGSPASLPDASQLALFVEELNLLRCRLLGQLTERACAEGLDPVWPTNFFRPLKQPTSTTPVGTTGSSARRGPTSAEDWCAIAEERVSDARALSENAPQSVGSVYMAGYGIECSLKALHKRRNMPFPSARAEGHDLRGLWESLGFKLSDIRDDSNGAKTYFVDRWSTDLRYEKAVDVPLPSAELVKGAGALTGWILTRVKRTANR